MVRFPSLETQNPMGLRVAEIIISCVIFQIKFQQADL